MRKVIYMFVLLLLCTSLYSQDTKPSGFVNINSPQWYYNPTTKNIAVYKGSTYLWNQFYSAKTTQAKLDSIINNFWSKTQITEADTTRWGLGGDGGNGWNYSTQTLSGTTPTLNVVNGINSKITLSGATTFTFSNLEDGMEGTIAVTNGGSATYKITFSGYSFKITQAVWDTGNRVYVSGSTKYDSFSWKYIGGVVQISGVLDLKN